MAQSLYDLFWVYPDPTPAQWEVPAALECRAGEAHAKVDSVERGIPAAILYPATLTPEVFVKNKDKMVELILLFKKDMDLKDEKLRERINCQLKVGRNLDPRKPYVPTPLFVEGNISKLIIIDTKRALDLNPVHRTGEGAKGRFCGTVERHVVELYKKNNFTKVCCVSLHPSMFESLLREPCSRQANLEKDGWILFRQEGRQDNQDYIIANALLNAKFDPAAKDKEVVHGFTVGARHSHGDVHVGEINKHLPVQTHHPVFVLDTLDYANLGHLSDIHICARQQVLRKGKAKVIEHGDFAQGLGHHVNVYSARVHEILTGFGEEPSVDLVVLGGDLMDHLPNAYRKDLYRHGWPAAEDIWDFVGLDGKWAEKYVNGVDFLSLYSLIIYFLRHHPKPIFVITGNHDHYASPYGISPRKLGRRANEGIPADHNLTIYEAILLFGPTYDQAFPLLSSPFDGDEGKWFYYYFTPFSDYSVELPNQKLVALAWGEDETVVTSEGQGLGHLPRATEAFTANQLNLLNEVVAEKGQKKLILTTHFTFVSYLEDLPNTHTGIVKMIDSDKWTKQDKFTMQDLGTFEHMRRRLYKELLWDEKAIQLVLTGHSHRRGLYRLTAFNSNSSQNDETIGTRHYDVRQCAHGGIRDLPDLAEKSHPPLIVLSDSGGPVPRLNISGEFYGWGSDLPGGTRILFDKSGEIQFIHVQETSLRPRFVVALDYMDIIAVEKEKCPKVIRSFSSRVDDVDGDETKRDKLWTFTLQFNHNKAFNDIGYKLPVSKLAIYLTDQLGQAEGQIRECIQFTPRDTGVNPALGPWSEWMIMDPTDRVKFNEHFLAREDRTTFAAIHFAEANAIPELARYDFSSPWTFEIKITSVIPTRKTKFYSIDRCNEEFPALDSRGKWLGYKRQG